MKNLKIRVWDGENMIQFEKFEASNTGGFWGGNREVYKIESVYEIGVGDKLPNGTPCGGYWHRDFSNDITCEDIMLSSGTFDKNGTEIYEGDIVKLSIGHQSHTEYNYQVTFKDATFSFEKLKVVSAPLAIINFILQSFDNIPELVNKDDVLKYVEVIGNIYQNTELL